MSRASEHLQFLESYNDFTKSDDYLHLRANIRAGLRCPQCGRKLARVYKVPAIRSCPSGHCDARYEITQDKRGLAFRKINTMEV